MVPCRIRIKMASHEFAFPDMRLEVQKPLSADRQVSSDANRGKRKERSQIHRSVEVRFCWKSFCWIQTSKSAKRGPAARKRRLCTSCLVGPLFSVSGPLERPKRGPAAFEQTVSEPSATEPLFDRFEPLKGQKGVQRPSVV